MSFTIDNATCTRDSSKAILVEADFFDESTWIPQAAVHVDSEVWEEGNAGTLVVEGWWARKEGWDE